MFIKKLLIKNFRCFGTQATVINFSKSGLTALIGPNNVGKSTILKALDILLGDRWPSSQFNPDDFHNNNLDEEIVLACQFFAPLDIEIYGRDYKINGVLIKARHLQTGYGESSVETDYNLIDTIQDFEHENWVPVKYNERPIKLSQAQKNCLPVAITIPLIKLQQEQPTNKWGILGRMMQKIENIISSDEVKSKEFKSKIKDAVSTLREPDEFKKIEKDITDFWNKMKPNNLGGTQLQFLDYEPWRYYRQFKLAITRDGKEVPIETLGEGVQRLAIIALYRTYLKHHGRNERAILLVEEPESYLHPQARKTLFNVLRQAIKETADVEGQIIYTTHSEDFVNCGDFEDIDILHQNIDAIESRHIVSENLKSHCVALGQLDSDICDPHIHFRLLETITQGLKEALFAHKAIIVEGPTEIELLRFFSDCDKEQIAIVSAGGKSSIPSVFSFLTAFGIPCLILVDRDEKNIGDNTKIANILNQINAATADGTRIQITKEEIDNVAEGEIYIKQRVLIFGGKLETVLDRRIINFNKLIQLLRSEFHLPTSGSKPREMQALGLAHKGTIPIENPELHTQIIVIKPQLDQLAIDLNSFIRCTVTRPSLLSQST